MVEISCERSTPKSTPKICLKVLKNAEIQNNLIYILKPCSNSIVTGVEHSKELFSDWSGTLKGTLYRVVFFIALGLSLEMIKLDEDEASNLSILMLMTPCRKRGLIPFYGMLL